MNKDVAKLISCPYSYTANYNVRVILRTTKFFYLAERDRRLVRSQRQDHREADGEEGHEQAQVRRSGRFRGPQSSEAERNSVARHVMTSSMIFFVVERDHCVVPLLRRFLLFAASC